MKNTAAGLAITIGVAMLSWHLFEKPINDLKRYFVYVGKPKVARQPSADSATAKSFAPET